MDNITIQKIWSDECFYEIEIAFYSKNISCKMNSYVPDGKMLELAESIIKFANKPQENKMQWELEVEDEKKILIRSGRADLYGRVSLEVQIIASVIYEQLILEDGSSDDFFAKFSIETEIGALYSFSECLKELESDELYNPISLRSKENGY